jgi:hypothetical protein
MTQITGGLHHSLLVDETEKMPMLLSDLMVKAITQVLTAEKSTKDAAAKEHDDDLSKGTIDFIK